MENSRTAKLHLELDIEFVDPAAMQAHARAWAQDQGDGDEASLAHTLAQAAESPGSALMLLVEPDDVLGHIPGVLALGAAMWVDDESVQAHAWPETDDEEPGAPGAPESEDDWLRTIFDAAEKLPGLDLELLGYDGEESDPDLRGHSLRQATTLRGAIHWAYEFLIDQLFDDVSALRTTPDAVDGTGQLDGTLHIDDTLQLSALPPLYRAHYTPLFAQRFLTVALDLGTAFARSFTSPSCVAQELALKLLLNGVEVLQDMLPALDLPGGWREDVEESLFADLDHEFLYDPALDGFTDDPALASLRIVNLEVSSWFTPFPDQRVNPYAANE
jgi:hypothetical protein